MKYGKKPVVKRFRLQKTKPGRMIRKATLERKGRARKRKLVRKSRPVRPTRKR